jgi:hypothetical protein
MRTSRWLVVATVASLAAAACSRSSTPSHAVTASTAAPTTVGVAPNPCSVPLRATDVGVTPADITIEVMADAIGTQDAFDAVNAFAARVNAHGGLACRQLKVRTWNSKIDPAESKDGQIDACHNALAMVGTGSGFNTDITTLDTCTDSTGHATGLPDIAGFSSELSQCGPTVFTIFPLPRSCPLPQGVSSYAIQSGYMKWQLQHDPGLHGLFLLEADVPALVVAEVPLLTAFQQTGVVWDAVPRVSFTEPQTAFIPSVQIARTKGSTFVFNAAIPSALVFMRREAEAQGATTVKVWACTDSCYSQSFLQQGGKDVEGTYVWLGFEPFEEAAYNADEEAFVTGVGAAKADLTGAYAWQAADAFQQAVTAVVAKAGPNGLTRANLLQAVRGITRFDANGWIGPHALSGQPSDSPCFVVMQVQNGRFVRVYPTTPGTMDCDPSNFTTVTIDATAAAANLK